MEIKIFHTNDIHSHLYNYLKIMNFLKNKKEQYGGSMLYVDIGDHVDRSHPYTEATLGKGNVELLNEAGCDVATIGNNEGITLEKNDLKTLYEDADFDVICSNLKEPEADVPFFNPYTIKEVNGIKIGFVAATVEFTPFYRALGWEVSDAFDWIMRAVEEVKDQVDCLIMLSHLGKYDDETLAMMFPEFDVILSSHTHHHFLNGDVVGNTLIGAAGRFGDYIGEVTLTFDGRKLTGSKARLTESDLLANVDDQYYDIGKFMLESQVVKDNMGQIPRTLYRPGRFISTLAEMLREFTESDAGIVHTGLIAKAFEGGTLTEYDLHKVLPHPINAVQIELSGRQLKEVFNQASRHEFKDEVVRGMGFRGDIFGTFVTDNIGCIQSERAYYVGGVPIDERKIYTLGTLDMYTFGRIFPQFKTARKKYIMPDFLRDIVRKYSENL